jgi:SulP family sulfate permease
MIKIRSLTAIMRTSLSDTLIVAFTLIVTVMVNLIAAVAAGVVIATMVTVAALARSGRIEAMPLKPHDPGADGAGPASAHEGTGADDIGLYRLEGPWFFAATHRLLQGLGQVSERRVVIFSMAGVSALDLTAARVLGEAITHLRNSGVTVLLAGVRPRHHRLIAHVTDDAHIPPTDLIHPDPAAALVHARSLIGSMDRPSPQRGRRA